MSVETNKRVFRGIPEELISSGDMSRKYEYFTEDFIERSPLPPGWPTGIAAVEQWVAAVRSAFPDFRVTVNNIIGEGDYVSGFVTVSGTHLGEFMGVPATGREVSFVEHHFGRMVNGRCAEHWGLVDFPTLMAQITAPSDAQVVTESEAGGWK